MPPRSTIFTITALTLAAVCIWPAQADEKRNLGKLEQNLDQRRAERQRLKAEAKRIKSEIAVLQNQLVGKAKTVQNAEVIARETKSRLVELRKRETFLGRQMTHDRAEIANLLAALLRLRRQPGVVAMATVQDTRQTARTAHLLALATSELDQRAETMRGELTRMVNLRAGIEEQHKALGINAANLSRDRKEIRKLLAAKQARQLQLRRQSRDTAREMAALAAKARDLRGLIARLEERRKRLAAQRAKAEARARTEAEAEAKAFAKAAEAAAARARTEERARARAAAEAQAREIAAAEARARAATKTRAMSEAAAKAARAKAEAEARARAKAEVAARAEAARQAARKKAANLAKARAQAKAEAERRKAEAKRQLALAPSLPFSARRGRLPLPARGPIIKSYGSSTSYGTAAHGVTVETIDGAQVISPHAGEVVFSGQFRGYGVVLIISHGEGYHSLLAGIARSYVAVGQQVLAGEPVAEMGQGPMKNRSLYVELRRKGSAIDPRSWWARARS